MLSIYCVFGWSEIFEFRSCILTFCNLEIHLFFRLFCDNAFDVIENTDIRLAVFRNARTE